MRKRKFPLKIAASLGALAFLLSWSFLIVDAAPNSMVVSDSGETTNTFLETPKASRSDHRAKAMIDRGLKHLVSLQVKSSGAWRGDVGLKYGGSHGAYRRDRLKQEHIGITALACMALVANGSTPQSGPYASNIRLGTDFILDNVLKGGQIVANGTRMYSNAFALLYLAEIYGMTGDSRIGSKLREAVGFIERNQVRDGINKGGWRYGAKQNDADVSVTVCLLQGLRGAKNVGVKVHQETIDLARDYVVRSYNSGNGSFKYQNSVGFDRQSFALTAAGLVALQSAGNYRNFRHNNRTIRFERSFRYLLDYRPDRANRVHSAVAKYSFWYGHYYAAQAMRQRATIDPDIWNNWNMLNRKNFAELQDPETGAWLDEIGQYDADQAAYATAMACLILAIPHNFLPIFQH